MSDYLNTKTQKIIQKSNVITSTFKDVMKVTCTILVHNYVVKINWKGYALNFCDTVVCMYKAILEKNLFSGVYFIV